jgi:hypothetical protein
MSKILNSLGYVFYLRLMLAALSNLLCSYVVSCNNVIQFDGWDEGNVI